MSKTNFSNLNKAFCFIECSHVTWTSLSALLKHSLNMVKFVLTPTDVQIFSVLGKKTKRGDCYCSTLQKVLMIAKGQNIA